MYSTVNLYAIDSVTLLPLPNAVFKVLDATNQQPVVLQTSAADGSVGLLLPAGEYEVRVFHFGTDFHGPRRIQVQADIESFDFPGERYHPTASLDARLCVVHGHFRHSDGRPYKNLDLHVTPLFAPILVDDAAVMGEDMVVRTDERGWVRLPLIRGAKYQIDLEGYDHGQKTVYFPDAAQWNLPDILFPRVVALEFTDAVRPVAVSVGEDVELDVSVVLSDGRRVPPTNPDVQWANSDSQKLYYSFTPTSVILRGLAAGDVTLTATCTSTSVYSIPHRDLTGSPIDVRVT
jgi:hypothetical protein